jgi:hypothetical protein
LSANTVTVATRHTHSTANRFFIVMQTPGWADCRSGV